MYEGLVSRINNKRAIKNADYIVSADVTIDGNVIASVITGVETQEGTLGIYFVPDIQLSIEYCEKNNLLARYDESGVKVAGSGYLSDKRKITAVKMRGVKSDGLWMPITSLMEFTEPRSKVASYKEGDKVGEPLARRYPKPEPKENTSTSGVKQIKLHANLPEHYDTEQFTHNLRTIENTPIGTLITITEKLEGTSARCGYVECDKPLKWYQKLWNTITQTWLGWDGYATKEYKLVHGTRRVIIGENSVGYHGNNTFRFDAIGTPDLPKDMVLYGEIVGYLPSGTPIQPEHNTEGFKEARKLYGDTFVYNYGLDVGMSKFYLYRVTQDGIDLPFSEVEAIGIKYGYDTVPVVALYEWDGNIKRLVDMVNELTADIMYSTIGNHPAEGVVIRVGNKAYKQKTFMYRVMSGIVKTDVIDTEEGS